MFMNRNMNMDTTRKVLDGGGGKKTTDGPIIKRRCSKEGGETKQKGSRNGSRNRNTKKNTDNE